MAFGDSLSARLAFAVFYGSRGSAEEGRDDNKYPDTARRGGDKTVPKFMVIHEAPSLALKEFLATPVGQNALAIGMRQLCTFDAYWVRAWAVPEQEKFYCEWNAKDAESIRRVFEKAPQPSFLIESIYEMRVIDAEQDIGR